MVWKTEQKRSTNPEDCFRERDRGADSAIEIGRQPCLLHEFVKCGSAPFAPSLRELAQSQLACEMPHRYCNHEKHSEHHQVFDFRYMKAEASWDEEEIPNQTTARGDQKHRTTVEF